MSDVATQSCGVLLREKLAELDADESSHLTVDEDPVERLRLDASRAVFAEQVGPMPRNGHRAYVAPVDPPVAEPGQRHLNLLR